MQLDDVFGGGGARVAAGCGAGVGGLEGLRGVEEVGAGFGGEGDGGVEEVGEVGIGFWRRAWSVLE